MKRMLQVFLIILLVIVIKLSFSYAVNYVIINSYNKQNYDTSLFGYLYFMNVQEPFIAYYNEGTVLYQKKSYEDAVDKFNSALEKNPSEKYVCDIRVNLALTKLELVDETNCEDAVDKLKEIKSILYENNCATEDGSGSSQAANDLLKEIVNKEEDIATKCSSSSDSDDSEDSEDSDDSDSNNQEQKEKEIEEKLKEQQKQSMETRGEEMEYYENEYVYNRDEKRW